MRAKCLRKRTDPHRVPERRSHERTDRSTFGAAPRSIAGSRGCRGGDCLPSRQDSGCRRRGHGTGDSRSGERLETCSPSSTPKGDVTYRLTRGFGLPRPQLRRPAPIHTLPAAAVGGPSQLFDRPVLPRNLILLDPIRQNCWAVGEFHEDRVPFRYDGELRRSVRRVPVGQKCTCAPHQ